MKDLNLADVWRQMHPQMRDYSFYSGRHSSHTQTDLFLLSTQFIHRAVESEYLPRTLSDHSLLTLTIFYARKSY